MKINVSFLLIFDIPRKNIGLKKKVNRMLHRSRAEFVQQSVWRSENLETLRKIANKIKSEGARASIIREEIVF